jgi:hypothetical protein
MTNAPGEILVFSQDDTAPLGIGGKKRERGPDTEVGYPGRNAAEVNKIGLCT